METHEATVVDAALLVPITKIITNMPIVILTLL